MKGIFRTFTFTLIAAAAIMFSAPSAQAGVKVIGIKPVPETPLPPVVATKYDTIQTHGVSPDGKRAVVLGIRHGQLVAQVRDTFSGAWRWNIDTWDSTWKQTEVQVGIGNDGVVLCTFYNRNKNVTSSRRITTIKGLDPESENTLTEVDYEACTGKGRLVLRSDGKLAVQELPKKTRKEKGAIGLIRSRDNLKNGGGENLYQELSDKIDKL